MDNTTTKREMRFRAWDKARQKMVFEFADDWRGKVYRLLFTEEGSLFCGNYLDNGDWQEPALMQFTGLRDKSGKEIYEGDIVKCQDHPTGTDNVTGVVTYHHGAFMIPGSMLLLRDYGTAWTEVIGNIYENAHLLKNEGLVVSEGLIDTNNGNN